MRLKYKIIEFVASKYSSTFMEYPQPAVRSIPEWYKKDNRFLDGDKKAGLQKGPSTFKNTTYKACMPFRDALSIGYTWSLPVDLEIRKLDGSYSIKWSTLNDIIGTHSKEQAPSLPTPVRASSDDLFKFNCDFSMKTPKNYSILYTHPFNRNDLPFRTFTGVVESDKYDIPVNFPFQVIVDLKEDTPFIIPKGTPVVQFIPIKRENWKHKKLIRDNQVELEKSLSILTGTIVNAYKKMFWVKKIYE